MTDRKEATSPDYPDALRARAARHTREAAILAPENMDPASPELTLRLLHELQVHQVELEMQNDDLRRTQGELEAARARYFDLYELAPVGYCTVSGKGLILEANLTAAALLGVTRSSLVNLPFTDFILSEDRGAYHVQRAQLGEEGTRHSWESRMLRADASFFWANLEAALSPGGEFRVTLNDISERKRAEATIARADARLRHLQKAESLERMAGSIAHHFNNKLQVVIGNLELATLVAARGAKPDGLLREAMDAAFLAAQMSTMMLTSLGITFSKREPLDLSLSCRRILPLIEESLPAGLTLETDLPIPGLVVRADAELIRQLLANLIANAGEALGTDGGTVRLAITAVPPVDIPLEHRFPVDWEPQNVAYACLEIADSGRGIADGDVEKIFDPFFSDKFVGRGLGLTLALGIVRMHGGSVVVQSESGRGSTFLVFLPLSNLLQESIPADRRNGT